MRAQKKPQWKAYFYFPDVLFWESRFSSCLKQPLVLPELLGDLMGEELCRKCSEPLRVRIGEYWTWMGVKSQKRDGSLTQKLSNQPLRNSGTGCDTDTPMCSLFLSFKQDFSKWSWFGLSWRLSLNRLWDTAERPKAVKSEWEKGNARTREGSSMKGGLRWESKPHCSH